LHDVKRSISGLIRLLEEAEAERDAQRMEIAERIALIESEPKVCRMRPKSRWWLVALAVVLGCAIAWVALG